MHEEDSEHCDNDFDGFDVENSNGVVMYIGEFLFKRPIRKIIYDLGRKKALMFCFSIIWDAYAC